MPGKGLVQSERRKMKFLFAMIWGIILGAVFHSLGFSAQKMSCSWQYWILCIVPNISIKTKGEKQ